MQLFEADENWCSTRFSKYDFLDLTRIRFAYGSPSLAVYSSMGWNQASIVLAKRPQRSHLIGSKAIGKVTKRGVNQEGEAPFFPMRLTWLS